MYLKSISQKQKKFIYTNCDFISIHLPLTKKTISLINKSNLKIMKKNVILINTSRGDIINRKRLIFFSEIKKNQRSNIRCV